MAYSGVMMVGQSTITDVATAKTNGRDIEYGRAFVDSLSDAELRGLILHENKHKMYQHSSIWKHLHREDAALANQACDYVINLEIVNMPGYGTFIALPEGGYVDSQYAGMARASSIFNALNENPW
jgi:predicted metal-dependent peptidase